jgi:gluconokinase
MKKNNIIFIMGVSGSGKSTIGQLLAQKTDLPFFDADDFHPPENVEKMSKGIPLNDEDRAPWLDNLNALAKEKEKTTGAIITCSALKETYRKRLQNGLSQEGILLFLNGSLDLLVARMRARKGHFMPLSLLESQLDTLEIPNNAYEINIEKEPDLIVEEVLGWLAK